LNKFTGNNSLKLNASFYLFFEPNQNQQIQLTPAVNIYLQELSICQFVSYQQSWAVGTSATSRGISLFAT
jgi:hypothetical protein